MANHTPALDDAVEHTDSVTASGAVPGDAEDARMQEIYRRVARGDTSVVSDVYWLQLLD